MSKRLALLLLLLCPFALPAAPAITVSGNSVTILGSAQTISLTCTLIDPNNSGNLRSGSNIITTFITSTTTPSNVATCGPIYGNDVITDGYGNASTTYYKVQVFTVSGGIVASTPSLQQFYAFTGSGTIDLATATPLAPSFFTGPTGNVVMPSTLTVTGASTFNGGITTTTTTSTGAGTHSGTETFTNAGIFTNTQMNQTMTSSVNGLNFLTEFQIAQGANTSTDGFASGVNCPVGATVYQCNGISGYVAVNGTSIHAGVAGNFIANCKINNCNVFGANPVAEDVAGLTTGVALTGTEVDTGPQNAITAYSGLFGITSAIGGTSTSWTPGTRVGGSAAFKAGSNAIAQNRAWAFGFSTQDQAVIDAAFLSGASCASSGTCNSQGLQFNSYNSGVLKSASITSTNTGSLLATPVSGGFFFMAAGAGFAANEGAAPSFNTSFDALWGDSTAHRWKMSNNGAAADFVVGDATADTFTAAKTFGTGSSINFSSLLISPTAPTIAAGGCGGGAASIVVSNGTAAFKVNVGTTPGSACTITMPSATTGWNCFATDITTNSTSVFLQKQTGAESQTSVVLTNFNDVAVATAFVASDILKVSCHAD